MGVGPCLLVCEDKGGKDVVNYCASPSRTCTSRLRHVHLPRCSLREKQDVYLGFVRLGLGVGSGLQVWATINLDPIP